MQIERPKVQYPQYLQINQQHSPSNMNNSSNHDQSNQSSSLNTSVSLRSKLPRTTANETNSRENRGDIRKDINKYTLSQAEAPKFGPESKLEQKKEVHTLPNSRMNTEHSNRNNRQENDNEENKKSEVKHSKPDETINSKNTVANLIEKFEKEKNEAISQAESINPLMIFEILQENFNPELFIKSSSEAPSIKEDISNCLHCEFKGNPDCQNVFCPEDHYWVKKNGSTIHARKAYVLYSFKNGSLENLLKNAVFAFFAKKVQFDLKHRILFVTLKTQIAGGFWDIFAETTGLKFKAACWEEGENCYGILCSEVELENYQINFNLSAEVQDIIVKHFSPARSICHMNHNSSKDNKSKKVPREQLIQQNGGKRSFQNFNENVDGEDPLPQKKVKGAWGNSSMNSGRQFEETSYEEENMASNKKKLRKSNGKKDYFEFLRRKFVKLGFKAYNHTKKDRLNDSTIMRLIDEQGIKTMDGLLDFCFQLASEKLDLMAYLTMNAEDIYKTWIQDSQSKDDSVPKSFEEFLEKENDITRTRMQNIFESSKSMNSLKKYFENTKGCVQENGGSIPMHNQSISTKSSESEFESELDQDSAESDKAGSQRIKVVKNKTNDSMELETDCNSKMNDSRSTVYAKEIFNENFSQIFST